LVKKLGSSQPHRGLTFPKGIGRFKSVIDWILPQFHQKECGKGLLQLICASNTNGEWYDEIEVFKLESPTGIHV
jgi:hypothetical protein